MAPHLLGARRRRYRASGHALVLQLLELAIGGPSSMLLNHQPAALGRRVLAQWPPPKGDCRLNPSRADCVQSTLGGVLAPKAKLKAGTVHSCPLCALCGRENMKGTQFCTDFCPNNCTGATGSAGATVAGSAVASG